MSDDSDTELGISYAKYKPDKRVDVIKINTPTRNIPKLTNACGRHYLWEEAVFLHSHYDEYDLATSAMMAHSPVAYTHDKLLMIMQKVPSMELYYRVLSFYVSLLKIALRKDVEKERAVSVFPIRMEQRRGPISRGKGGAKGGTMQPPNGATRSAA